VEADQEGAAPEVDMDRSSKSERILAEARSWLGTPWVHAQAAKGQGVDCAMLLCCVFHAAGTVPWIDPRPYPPDWHLHRDRERMLEIVRQYADPVTEASPGDVALFRYGRCASHAAIIESDEMLIHADLSARCVEQRERSALDDRLDSYWRVR